MQGSMDCKEEGEHDIPKKTYLAPHSYLFINPNKQFKVLVLGFLLFLLFICFSETWSHCVSLAGIKTVM